MLQCCALRCVRVAELMRSDHPLQSTPRPAAALPRACRSAPRTGEQLVRAVVAPRGHLPRCKVDFRDGAVPAGREQRAVLGGEVHVRHKVLVHPPPAAGGAGARVPELHVAVVVACGHGRTTEGGTENEATEKAAFRADVKEERVASVCRDGDAALRGSKYATVDTLSADRRDSARALGVRACCEDSLGDKREPVDPLFVRLLKPSHDCSTCDIEGADTAVGSAREGGGALAERRGGYGGEFGAPVGDGW